MRSLSTLASATIAIAITVGCAKKEPAPETAKSGTEDAAPAPAAPQIVLEMIAAHGGMNAWRAAPAVHFEDEFGSPGGPAIVSRVTVQQGPRRAYIEIPA